MPIAGLTEFTDAFFWSAAIPLAFGKTLASGHF